MSLEISYITYIVINDYAHIKTYTKDEIGTFSRLTYSKVGTFQTKNLVLLKYR